MQEQLSAADRLHWLLRTYADAATEYQPQPPSQTAGNRILPGEWRYYRELDHWLNHMRTTPHLYTLYVQLRDRYINPHARANLITHHGRWTRTRTGTIRGLPPNTELATPNPYYVATPTKIARWPNTINPTILEDATSWLLTHMHGGRTDRIYLPPYLRAAPATTPARQPAQSLLASAATTTTTAP